MQENLFHEKNSCKSQIYFCKNFSLQPKRNILPKLCCTPCKFVYFDFVQQAACFHSTFNYLPVVQDFIDMFLAIKMHDVYVVQKTAKECKFQQTLFSFSRDSIMIRETNTSFESNKNESLLFFLSFLNPPDKETNDLSILKTLQMAERSEGLCL